MLVCVHVSVSIHWKLVGGELLFQYGPAVDVFGMSGTCVSIVRLPQLQRFGWLFVVVRNLFFLKLVSQEVG